MGFSTRQGLPARATLSASSQWLDGGVATYTASTSGSSMRASACEYARGMLWRVAKSSALNRSRRMTATKADPFAFWNPGPLLTSATSPQPIMPQRTVRRIDIVIVDTILGWRLRKPRRLELPAPVPYFFGTHFAESP